MQELMKLRFENLPIQILTKQPARAIYYKERDVDKLPKKYLKYLNIYFQYIDGILCDTGNKNKPVVKNLRESEGTRITIMGNLMHAAIFTGSENKHTIFKIKELLADYFKKELARLKPFKIRVFPIIVEMKFYLKYKEDMDEDGIRLFYDKVLKDHIQDFIYARPKHKGEKAVLVGNPNGIIPNDNLKYIIGSNFRTFYYDAGPPYLDVKLLGYESQFEKECDYRDIPYAAAKPEWDTVRQTTAMVENTFARRKIVPFDENGEILEKYSQEYQAIYDFYFNYYSS